MSRIDKITEEKIKSAAGIVDVLGDFIELRRKGVNYQALCPFHDDKHVGSFVVSPKHNCYKCFSCDAKGGPVDFLMKHEGLTYPDALRYLAKKYNIVIDDPLDDVRYRNIRPATPRSLEPEKPRDMLTLDRETLKQTMTMADDHNLFVYWLRHLPWDTDEERNRLQQVLWLYCVGGWRDGRVVFWQVDADGKIRSGKLMKYLTDGHRDKERNPGWIHNQDGVRQKLDLEGHEYRATLFGMHLTKRYPNAILHIVESEKTALICATHYGNPDKNLWLACGGLKHLREDDIKQLTEQGRTIYLWPDRDGIDDWRLLFDTMDVDRSRISYQTGYWRDDDPPKADIADVIVRTMMGVQQDSALTDEEKELLACEEWKELHGDEPFGYIFDDIDPRVREWREILRNRYNFNKRYDDDRR